MLRFDRCLDCKYFDSKHEDIGQLYVRMNPSVIYGVCLCETAFYGETCDGCYIPCSEFEPVYDSGGLSLRYGLK